MTNCEYYLKHLKIIQKNLQKFLPLIDNKYFERDLKDFLRYLDLEIFLTDLKIKNKNEDFYSSLYTIYDFIDKE